ncbi:sugar transferase [Actibacterium lipolyticum]|uniref:Undecaprenyl phosphate N,N'-diacetylbacillosamine 1-phosphate transferase n=1 Tax=Actibacterium lipolyticum TaxID=1524263 RepID=A0A238KPR2_9RHOB|nr:sugar transferase [Actibacterium lipolyticum]SMX44728.1 Undecaprenyl phosphate N,N'-diacetylbacillosamine 1-phosphate transferase [Actibacterium lipolyticum]
MKDTVFTFDASSLDAAVTSPAQDNLYVRVGKRVFDVSLALMLLPLLLPIIATLWIITKRDGGPGFFGHKRIGQSGREFKCWKVRTMAVDAEERLSAHLAANPEAAKEWVQDYKLTDDPRIMPMGNFLRETGLDELPQIWNVLRGEMSLVGPRPVVKDELARYEGFQWAYFATKPGVTGLWQVSGRNEVSYAKRVRMDADYIRQRSLGYDLMVIGKTAKTVLLRTGK